MDNTDKKILSVLASNAAASATDIGEAVHLSIPAVNKRIQRLQKDGVIRSFTVVTDGKAAGKPITAFIMIVLRYSSGTEEFERYIANDRDVLECYAVTGEYDYILKVCASDVEALESKLLALKQQKGVVKSHTMLSLMEHKYQPTILPDIDKEDDSHEA